MTHPLGIYALVSRVDTPPHGMVQGGEAGRLLDSRWWAAREEAVI